MAIADDLLLHEDEVLEIDGSEESRSVKLSEEGELIETPLSPLSPTVLKSTVVVKEVNKKETKLSIATHDCCS